MSHKPTAVVIGAGIGGIATAARLAKNGYELIVREKEATTGGCSFEIICRGHLDERSEEDWDAHVNRARAPVITRIDKGISTISVQKVCKAFVSQAWRILYAQQNLRR